MSPAPDTLDLAAIRVRHTLMLLSLLWKGDRARVDLAHELGLSRSAIGNIVNELLAVDLVQEVGQREDGSVGRRATLLRLNARAATLLAVDLGASHARMDLLDLRCRTLSTRTVSHDITLGPGATYRLLAGLLDQMLLDPQIDRTKIALLGIGVPGPVDHHTGCVVQPPNMPGWDSENIAAGLGQLVALPVLVDNDANLGALAESRFGVHAGLSDLIYIKAATGIGAGILLGGQLHRGVRGGAGEIGHISINEQGPVGRSGNPGSLESYAAAQVLPPLAAQLRAAGTRTQLPDPASLQDLLTHAAHDPLARAVWETTGHHVGVAVSILLNLFNPQAVVIGGRLAQAGEVFLDAICASARGRTMHINADRAHLALGTLGVETGVLGAGAMMMDHLLTPRGLPLLYSIAQRTAWPVSREASLLTQDAASRAPPAVAGQDTRPSPTHPHPNFPWRKT
ncbi:ROK family transcriptional regulator [Deinococcus arenicola]|uniref:ROK family transcriptional regulator n=1 Tax=Deinococcus arenicola TaxID=2994950 RepID=A0ABU4DP61_9DEIO|nr:ROK family transcriptional regulator [Deinococcus sp. ZS9-10]MDV6374217.1 ROK family transcriptional regulator [Deinococcus sp. ZS9-10]